MYASPILRRPLFAFGAAIAFSILYFVAVRMLLPPPTPQTLIVYMALWLVPVPVCGAFHFTVVMGSDLRRSRKWAQIITSAVGAPLLAFYGLLLVTIIATGQGL
jgi:hypothetical protein